MCYTIFLITLKLFSVIYIREKNENNYILCMKFEYIFISGIVLYGQSFIHIIIYIYKKKHYQGIFCCFIELFCVIITSLGYNRRTKTYQFFYFYIIDINKL